MVFKFSKSPYLPRENFLNDFGGFSRVNLRALKKIKKIREKYTVFLNTSRGSFDNNLIFWGSVKLHLNIP